MDEPFFSDLAPRPNSQTGDEKRPEISVKIGNAGGYGFDSDEPVDTTIAESMALAHWLAVRAMREQAEEMMINL